MTGTTGSGNESGSGASGAGAGEVQWYIARDGQQHGPLNEAEIRLFVEGGHLRPTDLVWRPGFAEWRPALQVFPPRQKPADPPLPAMPAPAPAQPRPAGGPQAASPGSPSTQPDAARATTSASSQQPGMQTDPRTQPRAAIQPTDNGSQTGRPTETTGRPQPTTVGRAASQQRPAAGTNLARTTATEGPAPYEPEPPRSRKKSIVLGAILLAAIGASAWFIVANKDTVLQMAGVSKPADGKVPVVKAEPSVTSSLKKPAPAAATPPPRPVAPAAVAPPAAPTDAELATIDTVLQKRPLWTYMKGQFPDWYGERVKEAAALATQKKADRDITKHLVEQLVALRRKNADLALKASSGRHKAIATAFLDNLQTLSGRSADTCYRFISQGETSPIIVDLINDVATASSIETQVIRIFEAVSEGKSQPAAHDRPKKEDYDVLAAQLGKIGWSQADLQMFADPKALSGAAPARVCQMVRDWFKAHVDITDAAVQERLLFETLRPVVAG